MKKLISLSFLLHLTYICLSQESRTIQILNANRASFDSRVRADAQVLVGNVQMMHRGVLMICDSALLFQGANRLEAYGNVHINQGDTLHLYGDSLFYNGNNRLGRVQGNVRLNDRDMQLTTNSLLYDAAKSWAYYNTGGTIISTKNQNVLTSVRGTYESKTKVFHFKENVVLVNPEYTVNTDTMDYNNATEIAYFFGPTTITSEENFLYSENGFYNTKRDFARFQKNAYMISGDQRLEGDSLTYDRNTGIGQVFKNIIITDTINMFLIYGDYGIHYDSSKTSLITKNPRAIKIFEQDSLFIKADSIFALEDTLGLQSLRAFHHVAFFKSDMQGRSDTLVYQEKDSSLALMHLPVVWSANNQITGHTIKVYNDGQQAREIFINEDALIIELVDTAYNQFNQIKGRELHGYFRNNELYLIEIFGNGQSVYYALEEESDSTMSLLGVNKAESSDIRILLEDQEISSIAFLKKPNAVTLPPSSIGSPELLLKGFTWRLSERPKSREEIMVVPPEVMTSPAEPLQSPKPPQKPKRR